MAEIAINHRKGKKRRRSKRLSTRVDFTPMVDLGFLLITFFMLATTLNKPQTMELALPAKEKIPEAERTKVKASKTVTILLDKENALFYYEGTKENEIDPPLIRTNYSTAGLRQYLLKRNFEVMARVRELNVAKEQKKLTEKEYEARRSELKKDKNGPIVLIKATEGAVYGNLIDVLDEMAICNIDRYAILDITADDLRMIAHWKENNANVNGGK
ncbi:MAG: biopolymer transporter ExbD [Marinilabiliales bacterium]|nr:biopolymer transporter ExbD [Marinilabiliales bacterium]